MIFFINIINENYKLILSVSFLFLIIIFLLQIKILFIIFWKAFFFKIKKGLKKLKKRISSNKKIKLFCKRNPKFILFLQNRFDKTNFFWLPFTILFFIFLYLLTEYIWFTKAVLDWDLITQIDIRLSDFFYYFKDKRLIKIFLFFSYFWELKIVILISFLLLVILFLKWKIFHIIWFLSGLWVSSFIALLSKTITQRERPEFAVFKRLWYSFPSFHATVSVALYSFIIWLLLFKIKKWKKRINLIFAWILISFLIGFSRLYLNVSYLSDVISWWFLWFLGLILWITIVWFLRHKYKLKKVKYFKKQSNLLIIFLLFIGFIYIYISFNNYYNSIKFIEAKDNVILKINSIKELFIRYPNLRFTETITWRKTEPINFIFLVRNDKDIRKLFRASWWYNADKLWRTSIKNMTQALFDDKKYNTAPITPLYWNKQIQNYAFQKLTEQDTIKLRHHIRIWKTRYKIWDYFILVWCGIYDDWLKRGITHRIDPDIDKEREYIINSIKNNILIKTVDKIQLTKKFIWKNFSWDSFFTDGKAYLIKLK